MGAFLQICLMREAIPARLLGKYQAIRNILLAVLRQNTRIYETPSVVSALNGAA